MRNPAYRSLTDQQLIKIDGLCDLFDRELVSGAAPRIETFLSDAPEFAQAGLLAELLAMELEYRTGHGEEPSSDEYLQRFPSLPSVIADVFDERASNQTRGKNTTAEASDSVFRTCEIPPNLHGFRFIEVIGQGGMGVVWRADQIQPVKRQVAIKLIRTHLQTREVLARFDAEKQALAMMEHRNIARVLDAGITHDGRPYFVMELIDGSPITQYCDDHKLAIDDRLKLFISVCNAVQHAHQKGIIHRDLKPSNVLVTTNDGEAVPKVIDFGLAKAVGQDLQLTEATMLTEFGKVVGTVQYMSPEQAELKGVNAQDIDTRTDVYSLGVLLYELLTGSTPLDKETLGQNALLKILELIRDEDPPRPSSRLSSSSHDVNSAIGDLRKLRPARLQQLLRGELDWVVMKALEKDRSRRYQSAHDLAQDLTSYLAGDAVAARPPSTWYQVQKFAKRNRGVVAALLAIGAVLILGIVGTSYGLIRAIDKTKLAVDMTLEADAEREKAILASREAAFESQRARDSEANATFQLAIARYDAHRAADARSLLHEMPHSYRDSFEWHYSKRRFEGSDITCHGHAGDVHEVTFAPDGKRIVSAGADGKIKVWNAITGHELATIAGHEGPVSGLAVSPDGSLIASAGRDKIVKLWDSESSELIRSMNGHDGSINYLAFSPTGDRVATSSSDKTIKLWDTKTGVEVVTLVGHTAAVWGVAFSPDGKRLASTCHGDKTVRVWNALTGEQIALVREGREATRRVAFSPDGSRMATVSFGTLSLWDAQTWKLVGDNQLAHELSVNCVAFSPDGTQLATGAEDRLVKLWDAASGQLVRTLCGHAHRGVWSVAFSPDGSRLVSGGFDGTVRIWNTDASNGLPLHGNARVNSLDFSADGNLLAAGRDEGTIIVRSANTYETLFTSKKHVGSVNSLSFSPDGSMLASAADDKTVRLWNTKTSEEVAVLKGHRKWVRGVAFSPDGRQIASAGWDGDLKLWDAIAHQEIRTLKGHRGGLYCVAFNPDGSCLASGGSDNTIRLWDARTGQALRTLKDDALVRSIAFSPDGKRLVSAGYSWKIRVWDVVTGDQVVVAARTTGAIFDVAFSSDGKRIATASSGIQLIDAFTGREVASIDTSHGSSAIAFSPDGNRLAAGAGGTIGSVQVCRADQEHETTYLHGHKHAVDNVTFSADGSQIYSESENEKLVWKLSETDITTASAPQHQNSSIGLSESRQAVQLTKDIRVQQDPSAAWEPLDVITQISPDGRWLVTKESNNVVLVDLQYKDRPGEKNFRLAATSFDALGHQQRAEKASATGNWYAAVFHYALLMQHDPDQASYYDGLSSCYQELQSQYQQSELDLEPHVPKLVNEALQLPRGSQLPVMPAGEAKAINNATWQRVRTPNAFELAPLTDQELIQFREIVRQYPRDIYFNTLGSSEFRMGNFQEAIAAALESIELSSQVFPGDYAIVAMSYLALGQTHFANDYRQRFLESMKLDESKTDEDWLSFSAEVAKAFESNLGIGTK
ncbi:MAG: protein kinase [Pirellulaceae bacterium]